MGQHLMPYSLGAPAASGLVTITSPATYFSKYAFHIIHPILDTRERPPQSHHFGGLRLRAPTFRFLGRVLAT